MSNSNDCPYCGSAECLTLRQQYRVVDWRYKMVFMYQCYSWHRLVESPTKTRRSKLCLERERLKSAGLYPYLTYIVNGDSLVLEQNPQDDKGPAT